MGRIFCLGVVVVLAACGSEIGNEVDGQEDKADLYDSLRVPHLLDFSGGNFGDWGHIEGIIPGRVAEYHAPNDGWMGFKMILRQGAHLDIHTWLIGSTDTPSVSVEVYRWQGTIKGWGAPLIDETGVYTGPYPTPMVAPEYEIPSYNPVSHWEVPEDGRYLVMFHTEEAAVLRLKVGTDERYYDASRCDDDPGLCERLDGEASCGFSCDEWDEQDLCVKPREPHAYCNYPVTGWGWTVQE